MAGRVLQPENPTQRTAIIDALEVVATETNSNPVFAAKLRHAHVAQNVRSHAISRVRWRRLHQPPSSGTTCGASGSRR
jgi:hypothetical protein